VDDATRYTLGLDVGGTKIYAGVVDLETGKVLNTARKRTHPERGVSFFAERLVAVAEDALSGAVLPKKAQVSAIGIGLAGQVNRQTGIVVGAPNLARGLVDFNVSQLLNERLHLPVRLGNDVEVAALGERYYGAGREAHDFVCVFIGTGVGAAIVEGDVIRRGTTGTAGEIGHTIVQLGGRICGCGGRGHLEAYASRTAITRVLVNELARGRVSKLSEYLKPADLAIRSRIIAQCEAEGDTLVVETLMEAADYLGAGLASVATFYNPHRIILGGGLIEATKVLFDRATIRAHEAALPAAGRGMEIVRTQLGDNSGIIGAAWLAAQQPAVAQT
jgi:glucokinase